MQGERTEVRAPAGMIAESGEVPWKRRLSSKLLFLTVIAVLIAEILIFIPSVANFRLRWLEERLNTAAAASIVLIGTDMADLPRNVQNDVLMALGARAVAVRSGGDSRLLVVSEMPPEVDEHVDLDQPGPVMAIGGALDTMFRGGDRMLRVSGRVGDSDKEFELIIADSGLRKAMLVYARNVAILSLIISLITAALVYAAIHRIMIGPVRSLRNAMIAFAEAPDDPARIIRPRRDRHDELGVAERELAAMQTELHRTLGERKHLADLGLAVSKINHDLRNMLASAQLISDRLGTVKDPSVQAFAPKLVRTLDRAVGYTESVLAYGRAQEPPPSRRRLRLRQLVEEVEGLLGIGDSGIVFENSVDAECEVDADAEQLFRVLTNLCRNAVQAMSADTESAVVRRLTVSAEREGSVSRIFVIDTGPGLPPKARENLFAAFRGAARSGGTGLGLAIAHELVRAHGGTIDLVESIGGRTVFGLVIPDQPVSLDKARHGLRRSG